MSETPFRLYNTLTREVEPLRTAEPGHLRLYGCGPTVYSYAHIGNFRSFLTSDLALRVARAVGWRTTYVSNITDVGHLTEDDVADAGGEDKMVRALRSKEGARFANIWDLARHYTTELVEDWQALNLLEPDVRPRATEHVREQIEAVEQLIEKGHAYETDRGVYFSVPSFPDYGRLSGNREADELDQGVRDVVQDEGKRDPRDFALWKKDPQHLMQWYSPWGWGFPGWHIECSVMAQKYLGQTIDLHAGGEDLTFPHHECEIAQAESLSGQPFSTHWMHTRFLHVEGEKMSKSRGNFVTVRDVIAPEDEGGRGVDPLALRYALISGHYRKPLNFTFDNLRAAVKIVARIRHADRVLVRQGRNVRADERGEDRAFETALEEDYRRALDAMLDDMNTPQALAAVLEGVGRIHSHDLNEHSAPAAEGFLTKVNALLGIVRHESEPHEDTPAADPFAAKVDALLAERTAARQARDFARADQLRAQAEALGVEIMDSPQGTTWRRKATV